MAALIYQCPVDPGCPTSPTPGYCGHHTRTKLARVRAPAADPAQTAGQDTSASAAPDEKSSAEACLPVIAVRFLGRTIQVPRDGLTLGRDAPHCRDLPGLIDLLQVSRQHARLYWQGADLYVADLDSTNGTFINGTRVGIPEPLRPGQTLRLGKDVDIPVIELELDEFGLPK